MALAYRLGYKRAVSVAGGADRIKTLHSLPSYYGFYAALWAGLPVLLLLGFWVGFQDVIVTGLVEVKLPAEMTAGLSAGQKSLLLNDIKKLATGNIVSGEVTPALQAAADNYAQLRDLANIALWSLVLAMPLGGLALVWKRIHPKLRARNRVESTLMVILVVFSSIAILTTLGILLSVIFESILFFQRVSVTEFFPRF